MFKLSRDPEPRKCARVTVLGSWGSWSPAPWTRGPRRPWAGLFSTPAAGLSADASFRLLAALFSGSVPCCGPLRCSLFCGPCFSWPSAWVWPERSTPTIPMSVPFGKGEKGPELDACPGRAAPPRNLFLVSSCPSMAFDLSRLCPISDPDFYLSLSLDPCGREPCSVAQAEGLAGMGVGMGRR